MKCVEKSTNRCNYRTNQHFMQLVDVFFDAKCLGCLLQMMLKDRAPFDAEVDAEVAKEYQRI